MFVKVLTVDLLIPGCSSLKEKRFVLQSLKSRLRGRFNASIAEVDHQDKWQRSTVVTAAVAGSAGGARLLADKVARFADSRFPDGVRVEYALASFDEVSGLG